MDRTKIEQILKENGYEDFKWISGKDVVVSQWPRFKCMYGCSSYGQKGSCPPSVPSVAECREFFREYEHIAVIHLQKKVNKPEGRKEWSRKTNAKLLKLERAAFLAGHQKAFLLLMDECRMCEECPGTRSECKNLQLSRPCPEGLGVDVFATVRKLGFPNRGANGLSADYEPVFVSDGRIREKRKQKEEGPEGLGDQGVENCQASRGSRTNVNRLCEAEAQAGAAVAGPEAEARGRPAEESIVVKAAAAYHALGAS